MTRTNVEVFTASSRIDVKIFTTQKYSRCWCSCGERQMCRSLCDIPGWLLLHQGNVGSDNEGVGRSQEVLSAAPGHLAASCLLAP